MALLAISCNILQADSTVRSKRAKMHSYVKTIRTGPWSTAHVQGIAVDKRGGYIYYSFTTMLVKTDMAGRVVGTVTGFLGHLGCLTFNDADGRVYGSLEYKNDNIGQNILRRSHSDRHFPDAWYIAIFDGAKINRQNIDFATGSVMKAVYLPTVLDDYAARVDSTRHRYGCIGIDGVTFGPAFGSRGGKRYLTCAYGIENDTHRTDNDYMVLLQYDISAWKSLARPLSQDALHQSGPAEPAGKYFVFTGNTSYGVQNLAYDSFTGNWFMFVYPGSKSQYLNNSLFIVDGKVKPKMQLLKGSATAEHGAVLTLLKDGLLDELHGIYGWESRYGTMGFAPLGDGNYYIAHNRHTPEGEAAVVHLYQWTGFTPSPFKLVK